MRPTMRSCASIICLTVVNLWSFPAWGQQPPPPGAQDQLRIVIVEGDGAINNIKQRVNREPIVQVEDENHKPIAGAAVTFFLPNEGASGVFANGGRTLTVTTNAQGRAVAAGIRPNNVAGQMQIRVTASFQGQTASAVITQTNIAAAAAGAGGAAAAGLSVTAKLLIILGIVGGGAAAGTAVALHNGGSSSSPAAAPIVIQPGQPTVGAPR